MSADLPGARPGSGVGPLIDAHTHTQPTREATEAFVGNLGLPVINDGTTDDLIVSMDRAGVAWSMIVPLVFAQDEVAAAVAGGADRDAAVADVLTRWHELNAWAARAAAEQPRRLKAVVGVDPVMMPADYLTREVHEQLAAGASGLKVAPMFVHLRPDDERMEIVWRLAVEHDVPVLSESGASAYGDSEVFGHPKYFAEVLRTYPRLKLQLAHLGIGAEEDMADVVRLSENVITDTAMRLGGMGEPVDPAAIAATIRRIGTDRAAFATNYPMMDQHAYAETFRALPLSAEELHQVGYANAARLWGAQ